MLVASPFFVSRRYFFLHLPHRKTIIRARKLEAELLERGVTCMIIFSILNLWQETSFESGACLVEAHGQPSHARGHLPKFSQVFFGNVSPTLFAASSSSSPAQWSDARRSSVKQSRLSEKLLRRRNCGSWWEPAGEGGGTHYIL